MSVVVLIRKDQLEVPGPTTVGQALDLLGLPPEQYMVIYRGELVGIDQPLADGDTIRLVGVMSGGQGSMSKAGH